MNKINDMKNHSHDKNRRIIPEDASGYDGYEITDE
jgi:hypothetical protein